MSNENEFEANADASLTVPMQASALRVGSFVLLHDAPCKITHMTSCKTGKHGGCKIHIMAADIFTDRKHESNFMSEDNADVPHVSKQDYQLINIDDEGFMSLLTGSSELREDLRVPDGQLGREIEEAFEQGKELIISTIKSMGREEPCGWSLRK